MPELFTIETDHLTLVWSRRRAKPPPVVPEKAETPFSLPVQALRRGVEPVVRIPQSGQTHLFEQTDYTLFAQSKRGEPVRVWHRDPVLVQGLQRSDEGRVVHGAINFGTQVGQSRFVVEAGSLAQFEFVVEVLTSKRGYRRGGECRCHHADSDSGPRRSGRFPQRFASRCPARFRARAVLLSRGP